MPPAKKPVGQASTDLKIASVATAPLTFRHARVTREILLDGVLVAYEFRRGKRKTIGFSVSAEGLVVSAPKWVALYEIDKSVLEKAGWIIKKLRETRDRHQQLEAVRIEWKNGARLKYLGDEVVVAIDPGYNLGRNGAVLKRCAAIEGDPLLTLLNANDSLPSDARAVTSPAQALQICLPLSASPEQIRDAAQTWLMQQAKKLFEGRLNHYAPYLDVKWRKLSLSSAGTRWGSASADGSIRLNWRLIHFKLPVIDYVVVHELSHLRVMDHSPRFWDTVRGVVPDYAELRGQLKKEIIPRW